MHHEHQNYCFGTLADYIDAMSGQLEIRAVLEDREVQITQFEKLAS